MLMRATLAAGVIHPSPLACVRIKGASSLRGAKRRSNPDSAQATLDCFAVARNNEQASASSRRQRARAMPTPFPKASSKSEGGRAPTGAKPTSAPRGPMSPSVRAFGRGSRSAERARLSALYRGARQGGRIHHWLSSSTAFPETRRGGRYPLRPVSSQPSSSETGRRAGRAGTQSRPGAVCETARGNRLPLRFQDRL